MSARKLLVFGVSGLLIVAAGCFSMPSSRTGNQGGSSVPGAVAKITTDQLGALNPDDVQVLTDLAMQVTGAHFPPVTDEQAAAVISFMQANNITNRATLQALIERAQANPNSVVIPDDVRQVLEQIAADPSAYIEGANEFAQEHGGQAGL